MEKRKRIISDSLLEPKFQKAFFWAIIIILIFLSYQIIKPYMIALISAFILAHLTRPVHNRLKKLIGNKLSAVITILIVLIIIIVPISLIFGGVAQQTHEYFSSGEFSSLLEKASQYPILSSIIQDFGLTTNSPSLSPVTDLLASAVSYIPTLIISLFIVVFGMYYILVEWDKLSLTLKSYIPFKNRKEIAKEISEVTNTIVYGTFLMALIEFSIAAVGFYLIGIKFFLLLALLIFILSFIPSIGPALVWVPALIYYLINQNYYASIGLIIIGVILSFIIDTAFRAKMLGDKSKINPLVMIIGILGGISVFGIFGFIIGPLILLYTIEILQTAMNNH